MVANFKTHEQTFATYSLLLSRGEEVEIGNGIWGQTQLPLPLKLKQTVIHWGAIKTTTF